MLAVRGLLGSHHPCYKRIAPAAKRGAPQAPGVTPMLLSHHELTQRMAQVRLLVLDVDGTLTDGNIWFDGEGRPFRALYCHDGAGLTLWRLAGHQAALVSGLGSAAAEAIRQQWDLIEVLSNVKDKVRAVDELAGRAGCTRAQTAYMGDDIIDRNVMRAVGLAVAVRDAVPRIREEAHWVTEAPGGRGAVREVVERLLDAQGILDATVERYCARTDHGQ